MFCLSSLLCELYQHFNDNSDSAEKRICITTTPETPEFIYSGAEQLNKQLSELILGILSVLRPESTLHLEVVSLKHLYDLNTLQFKLRFQVATPELRNHARLNDVVQHISNAGGWVKQSDWEAHLQEIILQYTVNAAPIHREINLPSWAYARHIKIVRQHVVPSTRCSASQVFESMGARVSVHDWSRTPLQAFEAIKAQTIDKSTLVLFDFEDLTLSIESLNGYLQAIYQEELKLDHADVIVLLTPAQYDGLNPEIQIQFGRSIVRAPLTAHRLCSPRGQFFHADFNFLLSTPIENTEKLSILLVERCDITKALLTNFLHGKGVNIHECENIADMDKIIQSIQLDLVLLELPPGSDHQAVCFAQEVIQKAKPLSLPVIGIKNSEESESIELCLQSAVNDCLEKPLNFDILLEKLHAWHLLKAPTLG